MRLVLVERERERERECMYLIISYHKPMSLPRSHECFELGCTKEGLDTVLLLGRCTVSLIDQLEQPTFESLDTTLPHERVHLLVQNLEYVDVGFVDGSAVFLIVDRFEYVDDRRVLGGGGREEFRFGHDGVGDRAGSLETRREGMLARGRERWFDAQRVLGRATW